MIIDAHAHVGPLIKDYVLRKKYEAHPFDTVESYLEDMDAAGVDMGISVARLDMDNEYQAEIQRRYPDRIISCAFINPRAPKAEDELKKCVEEWGLKGLMLDGFRHAFSSADHVLLDPLMKICEKSKIPVIMHSQGDNTFTTPVQLEEMARSFPQIKFIMSTGGNLWLAEEGTSVGERNNNIIVDTTTMEGFRITHNAKALAPQNFIMGSNWPWNDLKSVIFNVRRCVLNKEVLEWVLGRAAAEAFNIPLPASHWKGGDMS